MELKKINLKCTVIIVCYKLKLSLKAWRVCIWMQKVHCCVHFSEYSVFRAEQWQRWCTSPGTFVYRSREHVSRVNRGAQLSLFNSTRRTSGVAFTSAVISIEQFREHERQLLSLNQQHKLLQYKFLFFALTKYKLQ